ncbi:MAG: MFS transporter [Flammeovirgaceae bacterium]|nr:MFS transporter [Flammeovirgaceae bacterium]
MNLQAKSESNELIKDNPRIINAWCSYDWANSVYALTISSAIFPVYYNQVTRAAFDGNKVQFFGYSIENTVLYSYSLSFSFLVIVLLSPILSGIADYGGWKKRMMKFFVYLGGGACIALSFFHGKNIEFGIIASTLASIGWAGSLVFYNSYLPEITTPDRFDKISAKGFAMGYIGSVIQLIFSLIIVLNPEFFGIDEKSKLPAQLSFLTVGIWWIVFAQIAFYYLPGNIHHRKPTKGHLLKKGYKELYGVFNQVLKMEPIKRFLTALFFYNAGVQTVMLLAATFGEKEIKLDTGELIMTVLIIQLVAIAGAYLFARISELKSNKTSILVMLVIWIGVCIYAYLLKTPIEFYVLAFFVGMVMGGIQSMSRSTFSKLVPQKTVDTTSFFSFYDVTEKLSIVLGTFVYGAMEHYTESMRDGALALVAFFVVGLLFLLRFRMPAKEITV